MNTSKRTLQRKPKNIDTTFKKIEAEFQPKLTKTYLQEKQESIDEISYLLGFSESNTFVRFFKTLTGLTPMKYRKEAE